MAPGTSAFKANSPAPSGATLTSNVGGQFPISQTLSVANPGPQTFPAATGRPTLSGGFASGRTRLRGSTNSSTTEGINEEDDGLGGDGDNDDDDDDN